MQPESIWVTALQQQLDLLKEYGDKYRERTELVIGCAAELLGAVQKMLNYAEASETPQLKLLECLLDNQ